MVAPASASRAITTKPMPSAACTTRREPTTSSTGSTASQISAIEAARR
jgi:hypothetical protein